MAGAAPKEPPRVVSRCILLVGVYIPLGMVKPTRRDKTESLTLLPQKFDVFGFRALFAIRDL